MTPLPPPPTLWQRYFQLYQIVPIRPYLNVPFHWTPFNQIFHGLRTSSNYYVYGLGSNIHTFYCSTWIPTLWAAPLVSSSLAIFVFIPITRGWNASTTFFLAMIENSQCFISRGFYQLSWSKNVESPCRRKSTKVYTFWKETKRKGKTKTFISQTFNPRCVPVMCTATAS